MTPASEYELRAERELAAALAAVALALLLDAEDAARLYWLAADQDQDTLAVDSIAGFVSRTPSLADRVEVQSRRVLVPSTGASLDMLAADAAGAWGLRPPPCSQTSSDRKRRFPCDAAIS